MQITYRRAAERNAAESTAEYNGTRSGIQQIMHAMQCCGAHSGMQRNTQRRRADNTTTTERNAAQHSRIQRNMQWHTANTVAYILETKQPCC